MTTETGKPKRIQRRRTKGWRMGEGTVYVGRTTKWGNPFPVKKGIRTQAQAVAQFRNWIQSRPGLIAMAQEELAGRDLACWCPNGTVCHGDVLLEIANWEASPCR